MTFRLYAIEMENFKCYYGEHEFEFPQEAGLYYLTGTNKFNPRLGANAVGKSSIVDAIEWCFYGKTSRGLRATDVISWNKKSCKVSVSVQIGEEEYSVTRTQNPNTILINGNPTDQDSLTKLLRLNQEAFNCSIILPQFGESFFDLTPTRKLEMFSQVMNLDYWLEKSKKAGIKASLIETEIDVVGNQISRYEGNIEHIRSHIKDLKSKAISFTKEIKQEINNTKKEIEMQENKSNEYWEYLKKKTIKLKKYKNDLTEVLSAIHEAGDTFKKHNDKFMNIMTDINTNERYLKDLKNELYEIEKLKGTVCSKCKQKIDDRHIKKRQDQITEKIDKLNTQQKKLKKEIKAIEDQVEQSRKDVNELGHIKTELDQQHSKTDNDILNLENQIKACANNIERYNSDIVKLKKKENPFETLIINSKRQRKEIEQKLEKAKGKLDRFKINLESYSFWINGFKRVRLFVIEEALHSLEIEINNMLISLGLSGWKITLDVERENKSGGITKGFTVFIQSPKHDKPVKFESWSGGETQRLRIAGDLGLANLIMEQAGLKSEIEIIDEPSEHMSAEGIEDMIETLYQRAYDEEKQIWLVDHNTVEFAGFSGMLTAEMDSKGKATLNYQGQ